MARILIADDEVHITLVLEYNLRRAGYETLVANDGAMALKMANEHAPDLIVTDYQMPYMDGLEFASRLSDNPMTEHIPVIMLTARGHRVDPTEIGKTNIRHLLDKPFSPRGFIETVEQLLADGSSRENAA
ncbi:MAG: response regulator [Phycisphaerales bacterium]